MKEVYDFLANNSTVFLATSDQGEARVRPFQFQFEDSGRLWFCTGKSKEVYRQLQRDSRLEISCMGADMATLRLKGEANLDDDMSIKRRIIEQNSLVRSIFNSPENPDFSVFSIDHGSAFIFHLSGDAPKSFRF